MALYLTDQNGKPIQIAGFGISNTKIYNGLDSFDSTIALSAYQGNILNTKITELNTNILTLADSLASYYNKNETDLLLKDKARTSDIPTKTSELQNDGDGTSSFATEQYVDNNGGKIDSISINGIKQTIDQTKNVNIEITEYDDTEINRLIENKVDKEEGKGLSSNDYTIEEKTKLAELNNYEESITNLENNKLDKSEAVSLPVGSIFTSAIPLTDARVHLLDGSIISQTGVYETFANLIKALVSAGNPISCTQTEFDTDVSATGNCGKFVIDNDAGTIRLPKITTFIQGLSSITDIGKSFEAGLPNITGQFQGRNVYTNSLATYPDLYKSGAFSFEQNGASWSYMGSYTQNTSGANSVITLDASKSSSVYGKSSTVQPNATQFPYYIVLASGYKQQSQLDVDNIMNEVNDKLPLTGGTLTGDLTLDSNVKIRMNTGAAIVHYDSSIGCPTFGVSSLPTLIHGSATRPYYRLTNNPLALLSDIPHLYQHCIQCVGTNCNFTINLVNTHSTPGVDSIDSLMNYMQSYYNTQWVAANGKYYLNNTYSSEHIIMIRFQPGSFTIVGAPTGGNGGHSATIDVATMRNTISGIGTYTVQIM